MATGREADAPAWRKDSRASGFYFLVINESIEIVHSIMRSISRVCSSIGTEPEIPVKADSAALNLEKVREGDGRNPKR